MNYKKKQRKDKERYEMSSTLFYDPGKRTTRKGEVRIKGVPYVNEEKRKLREERRLKKQMRKEQKCKLNTIE